MSIAQVVNVVEIAIHKFTDKVIDISYASDIINSAALAIKELAST